MNTKEITTNPYRNIESDMLELGFQTTLAYEFERIMGWRWTWSMYYTRRLDERPVS